MSHACDRCEAPCDCQRADRCEHLCLQLANAATQRNNVTLSSEYQPDRQDIIGALIGRAITRVFITPTGDIELVFDDHSWVNLEPIGWEADGIGVTVHCDCDRRIVT